MNIIDRLTELEKAATAGPWEWKRKTVVRQLIAVGNEPRYLLVRTEARKEVFVGDNRQNYTNYDLLIAARNALPALLKVAAAAKAYHDMATSQYDSSRVEEFEWKQDALGAALAELEAQ